MNHQPPNTKFQISTPGSTHHIITKSQTHKYQLHTACGQLRAFNCVRVCPITNGDEVDWVAMCATIGAHSFSLLHIRPHSRSFILIGHYKWTWARLNHVQLWTTKTDEINYFDLILSEPFAFGQCWAGFCLTFCFSVLLISFPISFVFFFLFLLSCFSVQCFLSSFCFVVYLFRIFPPQCCGRTLPIPSATFVPIFLLNLTIQQNADVTHYGSVIICFCNNFVCGACYSSFFFV